MSCTRCAQWFEKSPSRLGHPRTQLALYMLTKLSAAAVGPRIEELRSSPAQHSTGIWTLRSRIKGSRGLCEICGRWAWGAWPQFPALPALYLFAQDSDLCVVILFVTISEGRTREEQSSCWGALPAGWQFIFQKPPFRPVFCLIGPVSGALNHSRQQSWIA